MLENLITREKKTGKFFKLITAGLINRFSSSLAFRPCSLDNSSCAADAAYSLLTHGWKLKDRPLTWWLDRRFVPMTTFWAVLHSVAFQVCMWNRNCNSTAGNHVVQPKPLAPRSRWELFWWLNVQVTVSLHLHFRIPPPVVTSPAAGTVLCFCNTVTLFGKSCCSQWVRDTKCAEFSSTTWSRFSIDHSEEHEGRNHAAGEFLKKKSSWEFPFSSKLGENHSRFNKAPLSYTLHLNFAKRGCCSNT